MSEDVGMQMIEATGFKVGIYLNTNFGVFIHDFEE